MKVVIVYRSNSEYGSAVEAYLRDFTNQTGKTIETLNPDTREGDEFCRTYDIVEYPSAIALDDEGTLQNFWKGSPLPTMSELGFYA